MNEQEVADMQATRTQQPTVYLVIGAGIGSRSAIAFSDRGELLETVEWNESNEPNWDEAGICDYRGAGGRAGFETLYRAMNEAETNARLIGYDPVVRVSEGEAPPLEDLIALVEERIQQSLTEWENGKNASPSELDYVIFADEILTFSDPTYRGSTEDGRDFMAEEIAEDEGERFHTLNALATWIVTQLKAE